VVNDSCEFVIFEGELTDAPGRMESWTEWLTHLGADDWQLTIVGTDFSGAQEAEPESELFTTEKLLMWLQERDSEDEPNRRVGIRLRALRAYAEEARLVGLLKLIEGIRRGRWPPKPPRPKVTAVSGIALLATAPNPRAEHVQPYLQIETTRGSGIMAMPSPDSGFVQCWLGENPFWAESWKCRLTKSLASQIRARIAERLGREPVIEIRFLTIVIIAASVASAYPGGTHQFSQDYPWSFQNPFLYAITTMSSEELDEILERMRQSGLIPGQDVAVGEMMHGEWIACSGIRFACRGELPFPKWFATYDPMYAATGVQSDAAQAPSA